MSTKALPCAGIDFFSALRSGQYIVRNWDRKRETHLYKSYPAANGEPRVGSFAFSECLLMSKLEMGTIATGWPFSWVDILRFFSCGEADMEDESWMERVVAWTRRTRSPRVALVAINQSEPRLLWAGFRSFDAITR